MGISGYGSVRTAADIHFDGVKTFSATLAPRRSELGEKVTEWMAENSNVEIVDTVVTQSSDKAFHCISITLFFRMT